MYVIGVKKWIESALYHNVLNNELYNKINTLLKDIKNPYY